MPTKTKFATIRESIVNRAAETAGHSIVASPHRVQHVHMLAEKLFDTAVAFGFYKGKAATATSPQTNIAGVWTTGQVSEDFHEAFAHAVEVLYIAGNHFAATDLASTGSARQRIVAEMAEEIIDNIHMEAQFVRDTEDGL